jgi:hypothetical protein
VIRIVQPIQTRDSNSAPVKSFWDVVHKSNTKKKNDHISKNSHTFICFWVFMSSLLSVLFNVNYFSFSLFSFFSPFMFICFMSILSVLSFLSFSISVLVPYLCVYFCTFCVYLCSDLWLFFVYLFLIFVFMCNIFCIILFYLVLFFILFYFNKELFFIYMIIIF